MSSIYYAIFLSNDNIVRYINSNANYTSVDAFFTNELATNFATARLVNVFTGNAANVINYRRLMYNGLTATQKANITANYAFDVTKFMIIGEVPTPISSDNITIGQNAGDVVDALGPLIAIGKSAGQFALKSNTLIGYEAGKQLTTGAANCCIGSGAGAHIVTSYNNTLIGEGVGVGYVGFNGICIGSSTTKLGVATTNNVVIGSNLAGFSLSSGSRNVMVGTTCAYQLTTGGDNVFVGNFSGKGVSTGSNNVCIGSSARVGTTSAASNIVIGKGAGVSLTTGSNNIIIGSPGAANDNGAIRIGTTAIHVQTYIQGVYGTGVTGAGMVVSTNGQIGIALSSKRYKKKIASVETESDIIYRLRPVSFAYNQEDEYALNYGLIAEEVAALDERLVISIKKQVETVRYEQLVPLLISAVQRLEQRVQLLERSRKK